MSKEKNNESAMERLARSKQEREAAKATSAKDADLVGQLAHENTGKPDFADLAKKLEDRKEQEANGENDDYVKMTIYIEANLAAAFNALITKRGQQKEFANQALQDFVQKKARELGL